MVGLHVVMDGTRLQMAGYPLGESHCRHTYVVLGTTRDGAFIMVNDVTFLEFILTGGGVVLHNQ